jgi:inner membrane protein
MDTPTQILLGATIGQALGGPRLGAQAALWGAAAGLLPDLDIVAAFRPLGEMLHHRGLTHALWFGPVVGTALGWLLWRTRGQARPETLAAWIAVMVAALVTHPLLDLFTTYGTQLLAPFSRTRFSLDAVPIIDPVYTILLVIALVIGWRQGWASRASLVWSWSALILSTAYLFYGWHLNHVAETRARADLARQGVVAADVHAYPTLLQAYYRRIVARGGDEIRIGWISLWNGRPIVWQRFETPPDPLVEQVRATTMGRVFEWFTDGQTVGSTQHTASGALVTIDDLRFGVPAAPREGLWGIQARFDAAGRLAGDVVRIRRRPPGNVRDYLRDILTSTFN